MLYARTNNERTTFQNLKEHSYNVARKAAGFAKPIGLSDTAFLFGMLHDLGKASPEWQHYLKTPNIETVPHSIVGASYLLSLTDQNDQMYPLLQQMYACIIQGHHGGLHDASDCYEKCEDFLSSEKLNNYSDFFNDVISETEVRSLLNKAIKEFSLYVKKFSNIIMSRNLDKTVASTEINFYIGLTTKFLHSCIIDADRLDAAGWEHEDDVNAEPPFDNFKYMQEKCAIYIDALASKSEATTKKEKEINKARQNIHDRCFQRNRDDTGIYKLNVPVGGGKTLTSLDFSLAHADFHSQDHVFYCIPYTTITEQTSDVIRKAIGSHNILEHHSNVKVQDEDDNEMVSSLRSASDVIWDFPVITTTTVQFMNSFFAHGSARRRLHYLSNSTIIFDEVQTMPLCYTYLFNLVIQFLSDICHSTVILCSATQPTFENEKCMKYPIFLAKNPELVSITSAETEIFKRTIAESIKKPMAIDEITQFVSGVHKQSTLIVVNKKAQAVQLFEELRKKYENVICLTTWECPNHRREKIKKLKDMLKSHEQVICVSTNLIEAGVDISFETAIRVMCGLPSIYQTDGRCARNGECVGHLYVIKWLDEKVSALGALSSEQNITRVLFDREAKNDAEELNLSDELISSYYHRFFSENEATGDGEISEINDSFLNLLSGNSNRYSSVRAKKALIKQDFATAEKYFNFINSPTKPIIVQTEKSCEIINSLSKKETNPRLLNHLLQGFTLNLYDYELKKLNQSGAIYSSEDGDLLILKKEWYSEDIGLSFEPFFV